MITNLLILIFLTFTSSFLINYIKKLKTDNEKENDINFWMFSYDFRSQKKEDYKPDSKLKLLKRRYKNKIILLSI